MEIRPDFVVVWQARYIPDDVPMWVGPRAAMPRDYYFKTKEDVDKFTKENHKFFFRVEKTLAVQHDDVYYPLSEKFIFKSEGMGIKLT